MATNFYYNNFPSSQITSEQLLVEDLVIEAMQIYGMDVYYMPRTSRDSVDYLFGDDSLKQYTSAHAIEMYMENVTGMDGEQDFISKFGLEVRDEVTLLVSRRRFAATVPISRPREGDLIYVPLVKNFFEITFVEHENDQAMFYTLGRGRGGNVYVYALKLKQFVFSEEVIDTGVDEVDEQAFDEYKRTRVILDTGSGTYIPEEIVFQGTDLANASARAVLHSYTKAPNVEISIIRVIGNFLPGSNVIGVTSGAEYVIDTVDDSTQVDENVFEDNADNTIIEQESDGIIDFSEKNPFGEP
jgi:hypothetical protein